MAAALLFVAFVAVHPLAAQAPPSVTETSLELTDGSVLRYAISVPQGYDASDSSPRPLVLALHPGGRSVYYGGSFMQSIVEPALRSWQAVMIAPDVPDSSWGTARSERAVLALLEHVMERHSIDPERVLVTGFSMGGAGAWYMASRHPERFTGAIVMAGSPRGVELETMADLPLYLIHSPQDEVVPFEPAEAAYFALAARDYTVELRVVPGFSHYMMGAYVPALRVAGDWMLDRWRAGAR